MRLIFLIITSSLVVISSCNFFNAPKNTADQYIEILEELDISQSESANKLSNLINSSDKGYLSRISNLYMTKNENSWRSELSVSMHSAIEAYWFENALTKNINDTTSFINYVLNDIMKHDQKRFKRAEYLKTVEIDPTINKVVYKIHIISKYNLTTDLNIFTYEGKSSLLLIPNITRYNQQRKKQNRFSARGDYIAQLLTKLSNEH